MENRNAEHYHDPTPADAVKRMAAEQRPHNGSVMEGDCITIALACVPPSMNRFAGRNNTWAYREAKAQYTALVAAVVGRNKPERPFDHAVVSITYRFKDHRRRDPDNYGGKMLLDGLTRAGVIVDDSFAHIDLHVRAEQGTGPERTTIRVYRKEGAHERPTADGCARV